ncbi:MAG: SHD1 domain-containing protein [Verrucomicrobiota bacterium]
MKKRVLNIIMLSILWAGVSGAEMRTWTSKTGDTIEAEFKSMFGSSKVVLKTSGGKTLKIPIDGLCAKDQEYLAAVVPPKIDIEVDVDKNQNNEFSATGYKRKRETIKCSAIVKKTSKAPCSRDFKAYLYVFAEQINGDIHWLISCADQSLSFKDDKKTFSFKSPPASVEWQDMTFADNRGFKYKGYIAVVEDSDGNVVAMESTRDLYEKNWGKIKGAPKGTKFDRQLDAVGGSHNSWSAGSL